MAVCSSYLPGMIDDCSRVRGGAKWLGGSGKLINIACQRVPDKVVRTVQYITASTWWSSGRDRILRQLLPCLGLCLLCVWESLPQATREAFWTVTSASSFAVVSWFVTRRHVMPVFVSITGKGPPTLEIYIHPETMCDNSFVWLRFSHKTASHSSTCCERNRGQTRSPFTSLC